ncbi:MAG: hypothetical protein PHI48_07900 [Bacteroidales bacterium]|nr:hypothetical protein [Bacteroidales bacterium]MDD4822465.1 hypothetical protein [Bacteroidales bacterium]
MKKISILKVTALAVAVGMSASENVNAQSVNAGADFVSSYVWRGIFQGNAGPAFQPTLSLTTGNFTVGAWGSTDFNAAKEFDLYVGYSIGNFSLTLTDYWWEGQGTAKYFDYKDNTTNHWFETSLGYNFGESLPLTLTWNTMVLGKDKDSDGDAMYSSYFEAKYSTAVKDVAVDLGLGAVPFKSDLYGTDGLAVTNIFVKGTKQVKVSDSFTLPVYVQAIFNPRAEQTHLVVGVTF